jgi:hypothetical protein
VVLEYLKSHRESKRSRPAEPWHGSQ